MIDRPWIEWPLVCVTLNPIKGWYNDYYGFCDLCVLRRESNGTVETVVDCRVRCIPADANKIRCIGEFTDAETQRFNLIGFDYTQQAKEIVDVLDAVCFGSKNALPVAVNPTLCRRLLHRAVRLVERKHPFNKDGVFVLREKSRWVDLGYLRCNVEPRFGGFALTPIDRVREALDRFDKIMEWHGVDRTWTAPQLLDWQEKEAPPF